MEGILRFTFAKFEIEQREKIGVHHVYRLVKPVAIIFNKGIERVDPTKRFDIGDICMHCRPQRNWRYCIRKYLSFLIFFLKPYPVQAIRFGMKPVITPFASYKKTN